MKFIVTGGEGFIGRALTAYLLSRENEVISVDRKNGLEAGEYFSSSDLSEVDCVFHLAAQTSVFNQNKGDIIRDNIETFKTVCDACKRHGVKLIYASSSTANHENTRSLYGISKQFNEQYARCYNPDATGVRFHNVYGPNPRHGTLLWYMLHQERVRLFNEGKNIRHFTYIDDIVKGLLMTYELNLSSVVNIANPEVTSTLQLAEIVSKYKHLEIELIAEKREFDCKEQIVNEAVYTLPLHYTPIEDGIRCIFANKPV